MSIPEKTEAILRPGQRLGGCTIQKRLAAGGMGVVYLARKEVLDRTVAIKVLHPEYAPRTDHLNRFLREAKVAASLDHDSIVRVYDGGEDHGLYYMVMEYVDGKDLRTLVNELGPLSPRKVLRYARAVADALFYAHNRGLIHRDIKPANILVGADGAPKLADFGLARLAADDHEVTRAGQILGTPAYMSPEQCRNGRLDARSDLYSLGATLYFLLSGAAPFTADTPVGLIHRVVNEPPPPLRHTAPNVPEETTALVARLMAKHPAARFQTGRELVDAIDEVLTGRVVAPLRVPVQRTAKAAGPGWIALAGMLAAAVGIGVYYVGQPAESETASAAPVPPVRPVHDPRPVRDDVPPHYIETVPDAAAGRQELEAVQKMTGRFVEALFAQDTDAALLCCQPAAAGHSILQDMIEESIEVLISFGMDSCHFRSFRRSMGLVRTEVIFTRKASEQSARLELQWRHDGETWRLEAMSSLPVE